VGVDGDPTGGLMEEPLGIFMELICISLEIFLDRDRRGGPKGCSGYRVWEAIAIVLIHTFFLIYGYFSRSLNCFVCRSCLFV
jgi:hypothetical protein